MRVKICGINSPAAFDAAVEAGADYLGLVFFAPSPRAVTAAEAALLSARSRGEPRRVGLFVSPTMSEIAAVLAEVRLDALQIHDVADVSAFRRFGLPVWRAVGVNSALDLPAALGGADELVFDAKPSPGATRPGGNAASFDWSIPRHWRKLAPWWLAGGLTPANVVAAVAASGAEGVDVSSGVESSLGVKSAALIRSFIAAARSAAK